jgi:hypothetical protein
MNNFSIDLELKTGVSYLDRMFFYGYKHGNYNLLWLFKHEANVAICFVL